MLFLLFLKILLSIQFHIFPVIYSYILRLSKMSCFTAFDAMCKKIVCPTKHSQINEKDLISRKFRRNHVNYDQFYVTNQKDEKLSVIVFPNNFEELPTIIYLHGNGGHKMESLQLVHPSINLVAFDFAGCGKSMGTYVTYGEKEAKDIDCVVKQIKRRYKARKIGLWGRSMGASLAMMYASMHSRQIFSLVLDTPFRQLKQVVRNVAEHNNKSIPSFIISFVLYLVEGKVQQMVGHNIFQTDFLMYLNLLNDTPIMFVASSQDIVVKQANVKQLYNSYKGHKELKFINSLHHQDRPRQMIEDGINFLLSDEGYRSARSSMTNSSKKGIPLSIRGNVHFAN